ncbi:MAG TPA: GNAT family N-acetyltransferase [Terriglobales bacterium]|nr:GNAT family N-acetyltransferase [Terriglobales bacterium]
MRAFFMKTDRLGFSEWAPADLELARLLWGDPAVSRYICAAGVFTSAEIEKRLTTECSNGQTVHMQYWPIFLLATGELVGCCGLRPHGEEGLELGFHLLPDFWGMGLASEAGAAAIRYARDNFPGRPIYAGHHPQNRASSRVLEKLGFSFVDVQFYPPTGLMHPTYILRQV